MAEPETDIATSAIKWLCDDPTFSPRDHVSISEALKSLGAEDPEDPLLVALVSEGVQAARGEALTPVIVKGWQPEFCGEDASRKACPEPVSGIGRCMTCGSQRKEPEKPSAAIKAAQQSAEEPMIDGDHDNGTPNDPDPGDMHIAPLHEAVEAHEKFLAEQPASGKPVSPRPDAPVRRKNAKPLKLTTIKVTNFNKVFEPPSTDTVQKLLDQMIEGVRGDLPLTLRLKRAAGLSDEEIGAFINRSRATVQAYAQDNRREILDAPQLKVLRTVLELRRDMITDLIAEMEAMQCPSES